MISSSHPAFAKLGPKLDRIFRELRSLQDFLKLYDSLSPELVTEWGRATPIAAAVSNAYNGIEEILFSLAKDIDGDVPRGDSSHQDLLDQMHAEIAGIRPPVLDEALHRSLTELKSFRHRVRHNYGFDLDLSRSEDNLARLRLCLPDFVDALRTVDRLLTAPEEDPEPSG